MTNTRELSSNSQDRKLVESTGNSRLREVQVDLNSTNSDSQSQRSSVTEMGVSPVTPNAGMAPVLTTPLLTGSLSVNSRPSSSVSPERRLDMVLGSESIQFIDHQNPDFKQMAIRPIPTFNSFGIANSNLPPIPGTTVCVRI